MPTDPAIRRPSRSKTMPPRIPVGFLTALGLGVCWLLVSDVAVADESTPDREGFADVLEAGWEAIAGGDPILDVNLRWGYAKQDMLDASHAATVRTRLGYQTGSFRGVSGLVEMVNTASPKPSGFFDGVETNEKGQTIIADPERTDVNRAWLGFAREDWAGLDLKGGRQRIKLDDDRWVGNVGWRQNEQTFDAARLQSNLGLEKLLVQYVHAWEVNRIFADRGPESRRDFNPRSHFVNVSYDHGPSLKGVFFAYLIDPSEDDFQGLGSQTYGVRLTGKVPIGETLSMPYQGSYAFQQDWGDNPTSYAAHYVFAEAGIARDQIGRISVGFELLGSDRDSVVVTPFSTAHKFNGFADVFLNNGGNRGLRDLFVSIAPEIPLAGVKLELIVHRFWDDQGGDLLGQEYDAVARYDINRHVGLLYKFAYFDGGRKAAFQTTTRSTWQLTVKF